MEKEILYYSDEVNDDFSGTDIETEHLTQKYNYHPKNPLLVLRKFLVYRIIATPAIAFYNKIIKRITYKNKKCMKGFKRKGCFMYGNHTAYTCDAFNPTYIAYPRRADVMVNEDSLSINGIKWLVKDLGALPIPQDLHMYNKFFEAINHSIKHKHWVAIYPEAHIWPYYTSVRPFVNTSFRYPVKLDAPVFAYTMTFAKRKHSSKPKITVYIDGPFLPDKTLPFKEAVQKLRDEVYAAMKERTDKYSTYEYKYSYVYRAACEGQASNGN